MAEHRDLVLAAVAEHDENERARAARWEAAVDVLGVEQGPPLREALRTLNLPVERLSAPAALCDDQTRVLVVTRPRYDETEAVVFRDTAAARDDWKLVYDLSDVVHELDGLFDRHGEPVDPVADGFTDPPRPDPDVVVQVAHRVTIRVPGRFEKYLLPGDTINVPKSYADRLRAAKMLVES